MTDPCQTCNEQLHIAQAMLRETRLMISSWASLVSDMRDFGLHAHEKVKFAHEMHQIGSLLPEMQE